MKKILGVVLCFAIMLSTTLAFTACTSNEFEIAVITDIGQLMDGGFNQGTWEGAKAYAEANNKTYKYYQPQNGSEATDADREAAMKQAIKNGAKIIVAPGFLQATALTNVATANPDVKFVFIDGWPLTDADNKVLSNVTAVVYKEQESGYLAGYATVMEGYTKLGGTFGGGGSNGACNRFAWGFIQGANDAAKEKDITVTMKYSYKFGDAFSASPELQTQISTWYASGVEVVFACGGSMVHSVKAAAEATTSGKIVGVDVDQSSISERVITSAVKGLSASVQKILGSFYAGNWDRELSGQASNLGAADDATGLPTATWRMTQFTKADYEALFAKVKAGTVVIDGNTDENCTSDEWIAKIQSATTNVTISFEK